MPSQRSIVVHVPRRTIVTAAAAIVRKMPFPLAYSRRRTTPLAGTLRPRCGMQVFALAGGVWSTRSVERAVVPAIRCWRIVKMPADTVAVCTGAPLPAADAVVSVIAPCVASTVVPVGRPALPSMRS